ncbi:hypothetical protein L3Q82_017167 [Scortum barcoo]|uniref:Uncharacterized protein n=1 Tax=Scortum barcoo TaxID=214431 RepID=A0ACB8VL94_9TELE|nr:hypothetical protein L3Q82_017167 [Scortum barcoo]
MWGSISTGAHCVSEGNDCEYRKVIMDFVDWCELNHLQVNASKTKEMVIDFSRKPSSEIAPVNIQGLDIERVRTYKYLGVHLNNKLDWTDNTDSLYKRGQSRLYMLRRLGSFVVCWGGGCSERDKKRLNRLIKRASSVCGCPLDSIEGLQLWLWTPASSIQVSSSERHANITPAYRRPRGFDSTSPACVLTHDAHCHFLKDKLHQDGIQSDRRLLLVFTLTSATKHQQ